MKTIILFFLFYLLNADKITEIEEQTGIPYSHMQKLSKFSAKSNLLIGIRPIEPSIRSLINEGYPTKNFHIKGKSSNWGPHIGFIPINQALSKLENKKGIEQSNKSIEDALKYSKEDAKSSVLRLSLNRILELDRIKVITIKEKKENIIKMEAIAPSKTKYSFSAVKSGDKYNIMYKKKDLLVIVNPLTLEAIISDYDLMFLSPSMSSFGVEDKRSLPYTKYEDYIKEKQQYFDKTSKSSEEDKKKYYSQEDKNRGNTSLRVNREIDTLNEALDRDENHKLIHHSDDAYNPYTNPESNYPVVIFLPKKIGSFGEKMNNSKGRLSIIKDEDELRIFIASAKNEGYHMSANKGWGEGMELIRSQSFESAIKTFNGKNKKSFKQQNRLSKSLQNRQESFEFLKEKFTEDKKIKDNWKNKILAFKKLSEEIRKCLVKIKD